MGVNIRDGAGGRFRCFASCRVVSFIKSWQRGGTAALPALNRKCKITPNCCMLNAYGCIKPVAPRFLPERARCVIVSTQKKVHHLLRG